MFRYVSWIILIFKVAEFAKILSPQTSSNWYVLKTTAQKVVLFKLLLHSHFLNWRQKQICLHYQKFFWCTNKQISRFTTLWGYLTFKGKISDKPPEKSGAVDNFQIMSDLTFLFIWHGNSKQTTDLSIFEIFTWLGCC